jgi:hypothetical protein
MSTEYPSLQGRFPSWASVEIRLRGRIYTQVTSLNWKQELKPTKVKGTGVIAKGGTRGEHDASGDLEMLLPGWQALRNDLSAQNSHRSYGLVEFQVFASWRESDGDPIQSVTLHRCRVQSVDSSNAEGGDPSKVKVELFVIRISEDNQDHLLNPADG